MDMEKDSYPTKKDLGRVYSPKELLEIFPEAKEVIPMKLKEWEEKEELLLQKLRKLMREAKKIDAKNAAFWSFLLKDLFEKKLQKIRKHIHRLNSYLYDEESKGKVITPCDIEKAKQVPISDIFEMLYEGVVKRSGKSYYCLCPFHEEKNPSFHIYPESNTFVCFGCGEKGDVIDLVKKMKKVNFKRAVEFLLKGGN